MCSPAAEQKETVMRRIVVFNKVSLDGFFAGPNGEIDWFGHDDEAGDIARSGDGRADMILFGRVTYEMFASFWPHLQIGPDTPEDMQSMAKDLNRMTKVVFSTTLKEVTWQNSRIVRGNVVEEVRKLKEASG